MLIEGIRTKFVSTKISLSTQGLKPFFSLLAGTRSHEQRARRGPIAGPLFSARSGGSLKFRVSNPWRGFKVCTCTFTAQNVLKRTALSGNGYVGHDERNRSSGRIIGPTFFRSIPLLEFLPILPSFSLATSNSI